MIKGIFVTGTGTDIGKTHVTARLVKHLKDKGLKVAYYKAALSGAIVLNDQIIPEDMEIVRKYAQLEYDDCKVSFIYTEAYAPHLASRNSSKPVDLEVIKNDLRELEESHDMVVIEGSGGIICPLRYDNQIIMLSDVIKLADYPLLIVTPSGLGSINGSVLTANYAKQLDLKILGFIMNEFEENNILHQDNKLMIEKLSDKPVLGCLKTNSDKINFYTDLLKKILII